MESKYWLHKICKQNNLEISDTQIELIDKFVLYLLEWNQKINLVSRRDEENIWQRHILASISFLFSFNFVSNTAIVDIGTGGGLPGIPLAILHPELKFTLIDSIQKKVKATEDIINRLQLKNASVVCSRAEELSTQTNYSASIDYVLARAVAPTKDIIVWSKGLLKTMKHARILPTIQNESKMTLIPGSILLLKGGDLTAEIEEARAKLQPREIIAHSLVIKGVEESELPDKKLIVIFP